MRQLFLLLSFLCSLTVGAQSFYDIDTIQEIKIYFGNTDWDYRMDTAKAGSEGYLAADSVAINGVTFLQCGVKYKGNSSYSASRIKNPLHIKLDWVIDQNYDGYDDVKLGNGFSDNAMIREPLSYQILRQYMNAPLSNFAKVYINDDYYGVMTNAESIDAIFLMKNYYSDKFTQIKCNPQNAGPGSGNGSNLAYNGNAISSYDTKYELQSDTGWSELINFCDTLNNAYAALNSIADIDRFLWMLAFNNVLVNLDSYSGSFRQNYYLYRNHADQWIPTMWDLNMSFGGFSTAGGTTSNLTATTMQTMSYLLHKNESGWPLIYKLLNDPFYEKMYLAHMRTINNENFANGAYKTSASAMHALVDDAVQTDVNYLGTYANFQVALTTNTVGSGSPGGTSPGIYPLMDNRTTYLSNVLSAAPPVITNVTVGSSLIFGTSTNINAQVTNSTAVYLGYRYAKQDRFVRVAMYDDGAHSDGVAGDGIFGASISLNSLDVQYYIYAENANTGAFSPERAEHEFYHLYPTITTASVNDIVINEITTNNKTGIENEKGKKKDWIELLNKTSTPLGLSGLYLSDDVANITKWAFPAEAFIQPGEHLLIWADDLDVTYLDLHTNFNLSNSSDNVILSNGSAIVDSISFGAIAEDNGVGRCADGVGSFATIINRTPRLVNDCTTDIDDLSEINISLFPNPTSDKFYLSADVEIKEVELYSLSGALVLAASSKAIDVANLPAGCYIVKVVLKDNHVWRSRMVKH